MKTYNQKSEAEQTALVEYWRNWLTRKDVPTTHESTLTDAEKDEFVMTDNASFGSWDFDAIANEWDAELVEEWGVDVWSMPSAEDIDNLFEEKQTKENVKNDTFEINITLPLQYEQDKDEIIKKLKNTLSDYQNFVVQ
jgi:hypothetical protein